MTRANGDIKDNVGRPVDNGQIGVVDPDTRLIGLHLYDGLLKARHLAALCLGCRHAVWCLYCRHPCLFSWLCGMWHTKPIASDRLHMLCCTWLAS